MLSGKKKRVNKVEEEEEDGKAQGCVRCIKKNSLSAGNKEGLPEKKERKQEEKEIRTKSPTYLVSQEQQQKDSTATTSTTTYVRTVHITVLLLLSPPSPPTHPPTHASSSQSRRQREKKSCAPRTNLEKEAKKRRKCVATSKCRVFVSLLSATLQISPTLSLALSLPTFV